MNKAILLSISFVFCFSSCVKNENIIEHPPAVLLLTKATINEVNETTFEYDSENRLTNRTINEAVTYDYTYDEQGNLTGYNEVYPSNSIQPIRKFEIDVNTDTEISGRYRLYNPSGVELPENVQYHTYKIENGLLKSVSQNGLYKEFYHNDYGNLTKYVLFQNPANNHLAEIHFSAWDYNSVSSQYVTPIHGFLPFHLLPTVKLSNNNPTNIQYIYAGWSQNSAPKNVMYDYNSDGQIERIFSEYVTYDEEENIIDSGESTSATYEYELGQ